MNMKPECPSCDRRAFLRLGVGLAAGLPFSLAYGGEAKAPITISRTPTPVVPPNRDNAKVAIVRCRTYGAEVTSALGKCLDLLGGVKPLVNGKTVTVKINLTSTQFNKVFDRPVGESFMTHSATAMALANLLFAGGAKRVRFIESTNRREPLEQVLDFAGWDVKALQALGNVEFEDTRNKGSGKDYTHLKVPGEGYLFSAFEVNHSYADTDVLVSLAKLKQHASAGVTLSMKNLFGMTPNTLYGQDAGSENAIGGRAPLHDPRGFEGGTLPGARIGTFPIGVGYRIPRIVADICAARPIDLAIIDGITAMQGGEGPWAAADNKIRLTTPGVLIAGLNPVSTDAVGTAVMGLGDPRARQGSGAFKTCDNHLLLAEQKGLGTAELSRIEVRGLAIDKVVYSYRS